MNMRSALVVCAFGFAVSLPAAERAVAQPAAKWHELFDGKSLDGWRGYKSDKAPQGWTVANGVLSKDGHVGDLISTAQFGDFELELEWKIGDGGNSGIFYRGVEDADFHGQPGDDRIYTTAPEYQLLDDIKAEDNKTPLTRAGSNYGLYPAAPGHLKPVGEWNKARIVARGPHIEHWLNGAKVCEYELWSPDWEAKVASTKFHNWPKFGRAKRGYLGVQGDHAGTLAFRNIRIREMK
jgi:hypothetical protein